MEEECNYTYYYLAPPSRGLLHVKIKIRSKQFALSMIVILLSTNNDYRQCKFYFQNKVKNAKSDNSLYSDKV